jgi:hypothetical protein
VTAELAPGIFYWKVTDKGGESTVSRFSVVRDEAPRIMLPADGSRFSYLASPPPVRFHWEASPNAVSCNVEIFRDASRKEHVVIHPVIGNSLSLDTLTEGTYYWQVRNVYGSPAVVSEMASALWSFTVKKTTSLAAPQHDQKGYSRTATILAVKSGQEKLGWRRVPGADSYQVELAKDSGFSAILARMAARYNYTVIPETCEKGTYYWRVTAQAGRDRSPPSEERQLIVAGSEVLETIAPAEGGRYPREAAGLSFSWMDPNRGAQYLVEVADSALFSTIIASQRVGDRRIVLRHLPAAMLFWRVSLVEKNGSRVAMSKPVSFSLYGHRKAPVLLAPRNGSTLDLIKLDQVLFQWEADHSVSRYRLLVFDAAAGRGAALIDSVSGENRHTVTDIRRFREREYVWEVTALEKTGNQEIPAGDTARGTFTITLTKRVILPGITEPEVVYEDAFTE